MSDVVTQYIEIDLPVCSLTYGQSPCTAAVGVTGERKCYNTRKTCQDIANYDETTNVLRLSESSLNLSPDIVSIPSVVSVSYTPSRLMLGESLGARSTLTIVCRDHPFSDTGPAGDKYRADRDFDPSHQGSFWGKFRARYPFLRGKTLRWLIARNGQPLSAMERRGFVIDRIEGPSSDGKVNIVAKDPLTLLDDKRAQAPRLSRGIIANAGGINAGATSLTLAPAGMGNLEYPASGIAAIGGREIVTFTRTNDVMTIVRGQFNTEAVAHDTDDRVQICLRYNGVDPGDIIRDLMINYSNIPSSFINQSDWNAETDEFLGRVYTALIAEPTSVVTLINEILEQAAMTVWWDEIARQIRLQVLRSVSAQFKYDDNIMMEGSFNISDQPDKRVSQAWTYFGQINPLERQDDPKNYRNTLLSVRLESEENHGTPAIKSIYSRWITQFGRTAAERLNNLILARYGEPPRMLSMRLLRGSGVPAPALGGGALVESFYTQDDTGVPVPIRTQIIEQRTSDATWDVKAEEITLQAIEETDDPTIKVVPIDVDTENFNLRTAYLQLYSETLSGDTVICEVRSGVVVTSANTSQPAWATGNGWPSGVTLQLRIEPGSFVVGRGGNGGTARSDGFVQRSFAQSGESGGSGMSIQATISIQNDGVIGGGGGGGGGAANFSSLFGASAGGGGAAAFGPRGTASTASGSGARPSANGVAGGVELGGAGGNASQIVAGGKGGNLGQAGGPGVILVSGQFNWTGSGGAAGAAVNGDSLVTWTTLGDVRGARIN